ncbi:MAG: hypothetical protein BWY21_01056 [Parcubacteria group bacterium ADurb.Bin216]|nr:MAG: hypothetical protein BWY21_01056 [Parcubacteria group bacterium ADurb.Bin216]
MRPTTLKNTIKFAIKNNLPGLIKGAPGVGKSDIVAQACREVNAELIVSHPVVSDPTDYKGLPFPDKEGKEAHFLPFGELNKLINADKLTVFFLDDLGQAPMSVQQAAMQLILARRINGFKISDKVIFMAATNRREDKAGVTGILEPVKSRFAWIVELVPSLDDWIDWAIENDMPHQLISFIKWRPQLLLDFNPTSDIINSPCPRTIAHAGRILNGNPPEDVRRELIEGAVGAGFAAEFEAFVNIYTKLPSLDDMIKNPTDIAIPEQPDMLYALCGLVAYGINEHNLSNLLKLIKRIPEEYQTMIMSVALAKAKKDKKDFIRHNSDFALWAKNMMNVLLTNNGR